MKYIIKYSIFAVILAASAYGIQFIGNHYDVFISVVLTILVALAAISFILHEVKNLNKKIK